MFTRFRIVIVSCSLIVDNVLCIVDIVKQIVIPEPLHGLVTGSCEPEPELIVLRLSDELIPGSDLRLVVGVGGLVVSAPAVAAGDVGQVQVGSAHPAEGGLVGELFIIFKLENCSN